MGFPRATIFAGEIARRLADAASKSPPREPPVRIAKRQGMRSHRADRIGVTWVRHAPRGARFPPARPCAERAQSRPRASAVTRPDQGPTPVRPVHSPCPNRELGDDLRRRDGCGVCGLLRSKRVVIPGGWGSCDPPSASCSGSIGRRLRVDHRCEKCEHRSCLRTALCRSSKRIGRCERTPATARVKLAIARKRANRRSERSDGELQCCRNSSARFEGATFRSVVASSLQ